MNLRDALRTGDLRRPQLAIVAVCTVLMMIDGYDSLLMAFVAPHLARAWKLGVVDLGYLLSASVLGSALGSLLLAPLADRIGRRRHIVASLAAIAVGMAASGWAPSVGWLAASRVFAGLFIGALLPSVNIIVSEYCPDRRRGTVMGVYGIGLPLGAALGGALTHPLVLAFEWRAPFLVGAVLTAAIGVVVLVGLPESIEFLIEKRPKGALAALNAIARRLGLPPEPVLPPAREKPPQGGHRAMLFGGPMLRRTLCLWLGFACLSAAFYFANTWTSKLMADVAGDPALGIRAGVLIVVGGMVGALLFAALALRLAPRAITTAFVACGALAYLAFATQLQHVPVAMLLAVAIGIFANGGVTAFYIVSPTVYATPVRATGVGWMVGVGRFAAIVVPVVTGYLLKAGWTPERLYFVFAGVLAAGAGCAWGLDRSYRVVPETRSIEPQTN